MEFDNTQESGEQSVEGTSGPESSPPAENQQEGSQQEAATQEQEKPAPFHEHPRFKEIIEQNRSYKSALDQQAQVTRQLQEQLQTLMQERHKQAAENTQDPNAKILERLQGIDPEFAKFQQQIVEELRNAQALKQELAELKQWKQHTDISSAQDNVNKSLNDLYTQNKVSDELRPVYKAMIREMVEQDTTGGKKPGVEDLPNYFKAVHENFSKMLTERDRKTRESYVSSKKADSTPAPATGGTPASSKPAPQKFGSMEEMIAAKTKLVAEGLRKAREKI